MHPSELNASYSMGNRVAYDQWGQRCRTKSVLEVRGMTNGPASAKWHARIGPRIIQAQRNRQYNCRFAHRHSLLALIIFLQFWGRLEALTMIAVSEIVVVVVVYSVESFESSARSVFRPARGRSRDLGSLVSGIT